MDIGSTKFSYIYMSVDRLFVVHLSETYCKIGSTSLAGIRIAMDGL